ncbi:MAG TPA: class I SAM-dependent methyltransferase [Burkholderiaceae bacterium]
MLIWPIPALLTWFGAWAFFVLLHQFGLAFAPALFLASLAGAVPALWQGKRWRRLMVAGGFPLSFIAISWGAGLPGWIWLLPLSLLALLYPRRSWADAPLFPTPRGALAELATLAPLPAGARVLDAGCGLGDGLVELRRAYPAAQLEGVEWSALLARLASWRCPHAKVWRGDMWAADWRSYQLLYIFQRPESMARAWGKFKAEALPGTCLVSLDFEVDGVAPMHRVELGGRHRLWIYRL